MSRSDVLVDADWLQDHLDDPTIAIVEVDEDTSAYEKNHIKNAIRIDWTQDLQDRSAATSSTRRASRSSCPTRASPTTTR